MTRLLLLVVLAGFLVIPAHGADKADPQTRATMNGVFNEIAVLMPLSVDQVAFAEPANREAIAHALELLTSRSRLLRIHGAERDEGFVHLARALSRDAGLARDAFGRGEVERARYRVRKLTENCVACHARTPGDAGGEFGMRLFHQMDVGQLDLEELAQLQQATRQYEAALLNYEDLLGQPGAARVWSVADYLSLCLRVRGDLTRPQPVLNALVVDQAVPEYLRRDIEIWLTDLRELMGRPALTEPLEEAAALIQHARGRQDFPADRQGLAYFLRAARHLDSFLAANPRGVKAAEAYYLLGMVEARLGTSPDLGQAEYLLEAAIRQAPGTEVAQKALTRLEWHLAIEYSGSAGQTLPAEVRESLDELRRLAGG